MWWSVDRILLSHVYFTKRFELLNRIDFEETVNCHFVCVPYKYIVYDELSF